MMMISTDPCRTPSRSRRKPPADPSNGFLLASAIVPLLVIAAFGVASLVD
jgi:hypothetical protein